MARSTTRPSPATDQQDLNALSTDDLRDLYRSLTAKECPKFLRRSMILLAVAHLLRIQRGDKLDAAHQRQLDALVAAIVPKGEAPPKVAPKVRKLRTGTRLVRQWHGERHEVLVVKGGFEWKGELHGSLSVIASRITGTRWNGWVFFGLKKAAPPATTTTTTTTASKEPLSCTSSSLAETAGGSHG